MSATKGRRRYDSLRRDAQARETRGQIARAARELFVAHGWAATTVRGVAREAGVSVPTVYSAYGGKTDLVRAVADAADLTADPAHMVAELEAAEGDPARQLTAMASYDRRLFERAGDVIALVRDAGRTEHDLAEAYRRARHRGDQTRVQVFDSWPGGTLRSGVDAARAVDIYAALCNIDVYAVLTGERGWSPEDVERWWSEALARELLS